MNENPGKFFKAVEETHTAKEIQISDIFNKIMAVILAQSGQSQAQSEQTEIQLKAQSKQIALVQMQFQTQSELITIVQT